jgi:hypothetical protein
LVFVTGFLLDFAPAGFGLSVWELVGELFEEEFFSGRFLREGEAFLDRALCWPLGMHELAVRPNGRFGR